MDKNIADIAQRFSIKATIDDITKLTTGHINDSYCITTCTTGCSGYFLQRINHNIFKNVEGLMENIRLVTEHLTEKLKQTPNLHSRTLEIVPTKEGKGFLHDENGNYWRMYKFIDHSHGYDVVENADIAYQGGKAFGQFMSLLADLPAEKLTETIPNFHNMETRLAAFYQVLEKDPVKRAVLVTNEIEFVKARAEKMLRIPALIRSGELPLRITHNDTKFNNILFDDNDDTTCIVDLDTVMPGSILFDFGDSIRTGANTADEDEPNLLKVDINLPIYEAYARGFVEVTKHTLTPAEIENLAFSAQFMTFIIGLRFLTDYIDGDNYFKTKYPEHNLVRAKVQFKLVEAMERDAKKMQDIILQTIKN